MTDKNPSTPIPPPEPFWEPCPTCEGKGKVKGIPPGMIVIRMDCRPRAGAPEWSDSPKEIAYYLGIIEKFIRIGIKEGGIRPVIFRGRKGFRLKDVKKWYETFRKVTPIIFEYMLQETFPNVHFIFDDKLGGYTVDMEYHRWLRAQRGR